MPELSPEGTPHGRELSPLKIGAKRAVSAASHNAPSGWPNDLDVGEGSPCAGAIEACGLPGALSCPLRHGVVVSGRTFGIPIQMVYDDLN